MKALRYDRYEAAPTIEDVPGPAMGVDQLLVRVEAAALNPLDIKLHSGRMQWHFKLELPYTMGSDFTGIVDQVGMNVRDWRPGDRVIGRLEPTKGGAFAAFAAVSQDDCTVLPPAMSMGLGAAIPTAAGTAWSSLFEVAKLAAGQTILIHAGAGGVGSFAVQFAKRAGAHVIATASGDGVELVRSLGADQVIDYRKRDFASALSTVDVVLDTVGGDTQERSFHLLRAGGHLVSVVSHPDRERAEAIGVRCSRVFYKLEPGALKSLVDQVVRDRLKILIDCEVPFERFGEALERQSSGRARGKIILDVGRTRGPAATT